MQIPRYFHISLSVALYATALNEEIISTLHSKSECPKDLTIIRLRHWNGRHDQEKLWQLST